jgi:micrococcal nuclease
MSWRRALPWLLLFVVLAVAGGGVLGGGDTEPRGPVAGRVVRVVDGDTVRVALGRGRETVRYIGMDTPETKKPGTPVQCFGRAAAKRNARLVGGRQVTLTFDRERRDRYGRLLAYVRREPDGLWINGALVAEGYARTLAIPPNTARAGRLARLQAQARAARRGLWGACPSRRAGLGWWQRQGRTGLDDGTAPPPRHGRRGAPRPPPGLAGLAGLADLARRVSSP